MTAKHTPGHPRHTVTRVTYRWIAGRPLDAKARTNATWLRPADEVLTPGGRASRWARLPGYKRQLWRHGTTAALAASAYGYATEPVLTEVAAGSIGTAGLALGTHRAVRAVRMRTHRRDWVQPLARTLQPSLYGDKRPPGDWLTVPLDVHQEGEVRVELPGYLGADRRREVLEIVRLKLGMTTDVIAEWKYAGRDQYLSVKRLPLPPGRVYLADAREHMLAAAESKPVIGLGRRNKVIAVDLDAESPHILISAGSGGGKSVQTRSIVAQLMRHGAQATFLDVKRQSHRWARNLPGVTYCRDTHEIHDQLIALAAEGERRNRLTDDIPDDVDTTTLDVGPRIVIVAEEMNATMNRLQAYWEEIRAKDDPKRSPAVSALAEILFMGRSVKIHVIAIAQLMTARTLGGPEARENFATRILTRYTVNAWRMLCPEIWPAPKSVRHPGRCQVVLGGEAHETQALFLTDKEAQEWTREALTTVPVEWSEAARNTSGNTVATGHDQGVALKTVAPMTLAEIADREVIPVKYGTLRSAKSRDASFPDPAGKRGERDVYRPVDVVAWYESKSSPSRPDRAVSEAIIGPADIDAHAAA